jgi:hypothetical protein
MKISRILFAGTGLTHLTLAGLSLAIFCPAAAAQLFDPYGGYPSRPPVQGKATGAAVGGVAGGLLGAAIGSKDGNTGEGALIGGLAGAVAGGMLGHQRDRAEFRQYNLEAQAYQQSVRSAVTYTDVIEMSRSGIGEDIIMRQIDAQGVAVRPGIQDLIMLKNNGVSDRVIAAMQAAWSPTDGQRAAPQVQQRYYAPQPAPVIVETWQPAPPVYYVPYAPPVHYHVHPHHCHPPRYGFHFDF